MDQGPKNPDCSMESTGILLACPWNERLLATSLYILQSLVKQLHGKIKNRSVEKK